jgi:hypothetical protein
MASVVRVYINVDRAQDVGRQRWAVAADPTIQELHVALGYDAHVVLSEEAATTLRNFLLAVVPDEGEARLAPTGDRARELR